jgi:hypothetical protein
VCTCLRVGWRTERWRCGMSLTAHCCIILSFLLDNEEILLKNYIKLNGWLTTFTHTYTHIEEKDCWVRLWRMSDLLMMLLLMNIFFLSISLILLQKLVYLFEAISSCTYFVLRMKIFEWAELAWVIYRLLVHTVYVWTQKRGDINGWKVRKSQIMEWELLPAFLIFAFRYVDPSVNGLRMKIRNNNFFSTSSRYELKIFP